MLQKNAEGNHRLRPSVARSRGGLQLLHFIRRRRLKQLDRFLPSNAAIVLVRLIGCSLVAVYFALWVMDVVISSTYERLLYSLYVCMLEKEFSPFRLNSSFRLGGGLGGGQFIYNIINANLLGRWICLWRSHSHYPAHKIQHELTAETVLLWVCSELLLYVMNDYYSIDSFLFFFLLMKPVSNGLICQVHLKYCKRSRFENFYWLAVYHISRNYNTRTQQSGRMNLVDFRFHFRMSYLTIEWILRLKNSLHLTSSIPLPIDQSIIYSNVYFGMFIRFCEEKRERVEQQHRIRSWKCRIPDASRRRWYRTSGTCRGTRDRCGPAGRDRTSGIDDGERGFRKLSEKSGGCGRYRDARQQHPTGRGPSLFRSGDRRRSGTCPGDGAPPSDLIFNIKTSIPDTTSAPRGADRSIFVPIETTHQLIRSLSVHLIESSRGSLVITDESEEVAGGALNQCEED